MKYTVYKIINRTNNKAYIGVTSTSIEERWRKHLYTAIKENKVWKLSRAIRKYKQKNFVIRVLYTTTNLNLAYKKEITYIKKFDTLKNGYNISSGGQGTIGVKHGNDFKHKISTIKSKKVIRSDGKIFNSATEAAKMTKNCTQSNITSCIYGKRRSCGGYTWKFLKNDPKRIRNINRLKAANNIAIYRFKARKIKCLTNNKTYISISSAARDLDADIRLIHKCCNKERNTTKGLRFKYVK